MNKVYPRNMEMVQSYRRTDLGVDKITMNIFYMKILLC